MMPPFKCQKKIDPTKLFPQSNKSSQKKHQTANELFLEKRVNENQAYFKSLSTKKAVSTSYLNKNRASVPKVLLQVLQHKWFCGAMLSCSTSTLYTIINISSSTQTLISSILSSYIRYSAGKMTTKRQPILRVYYKTYGSSTSKAMLVL